ncbi:MAG: glucans biosynthesis glucosyltransferase MdoH [Hyphomonadaceae bacterium]|nr:glucans biosynthesis glucosyltransferase MdoH [Hyphomonadaceae bacterium]
MTRLNRRPTEFPLTMPDQPFAQRAKRVRGAPASVLWRKLFVLAASIGLTGIAAHEMFEVLSVSGLTLLEWALLVIFVINIAWVAFAFVNATIGFLAALGSLRSKPTSISPASIQHARTVIAFPIYNEEVESVFATVAATAKLLAGAPGQFECFILSDTTNPEIALQEEAAFERLNAEAPADVAVRYRRRTINHHRKSGNIRDFITRWGGRYDYMIVYDADSYMERDTILRLVCEMEAKPHTALIQTIPQLVGGESLFARTQQFAAALYGPVLGHGLAWWAQNEGNFWGHNAIIRIKALAEAAGLPEIPGRAPFGGSILSHDFVEAALLRRAGWNVEIRPELGGSYEKGPPTIIDLVIRDRRWCQGNMQHMAVLLRTKGLTWTSRFHLITGIFSYLASPLWLIFITVGMMLSLQNSFLAPDYFGDGASLFPTWPVIDSERAFALFLATMGILFAPKIYGLLYGLAAREWRDSVGLLGTVKGVLLEIFLSVLTAPIMMAAQTGAVINVFLGRDSGWAPQNRNGDGYTFGDTMRHHRGAFILGLVLTGASIAISPIYAAWLAPATIGLILSGPLSYWTSRKSAGRTTKNGGWLVSPAEARAPESYRRAQEETGVFNQLAPATLGQLLLDRAKLGQRAHLVDSFWPLARHDVHPPLAMARARADRAKTVEEYISSLAQAEAMALLNSTADLEAVSWRLAPPVHANRAARGLRLVPLRNLQTELASRLKAGSGDVS